MSSKKSVQTEPDPVSRPVCIGFTPYRRRMNLPLTQLLIPYALKRIKR